MYTPVKAAFARCHGWYRKTFQRLIADQRGNAMIIAAAAIIPIVACIGGGLDVSRAYLVKARLHDACDVAALAGRRAMTNEDITTAQPEALKFFNFNFPKNYMGTASFTPTVTHPDTGVVEVKASTSTPTTLMKIFGYDSIPVSVDCDATQNFDNIDIVLVLDNTGSMNCLPSDSQYTSCPTEKSGSKISGVRQAVLALYDQLASAQAQLAAQGLRLRYGIVPYSSAVNGGNLIYAQSPTYIATSWTYQSRVPNFTTSWGRTVFSSWTYKPVTYDVSSFVSGGTLTTPTGTNGANTSLSWGGCVEEPQTDPTITSSSSTSSIPSGAYDLNIDLIPSSPSTQWKPLLADSSYNTAEFYRPTTAAYTTTNDYGGGASSFYLFTACPQQASRLAVMDRATLQSYLNSLYARGGTYHDEGMIWGARLLSPNGIFGSQNPTTYNSRPVHTFIIFMTDGFMQTDGCIPTSSCRPTQYTGYGIEGLDGRTGATSSDTDGRHQTRFLMACTAAKRMGVSIWAIDFGASAGSDPALQSCASNADQYAVSADNRSLIDKFAEIGKNIGALRLSK